MAVSIVMCVNTFSAFFGQLNWCDLQNAAQEVMQLRQAVQQLQQQLHSSTRAAKQIEQHLHEKVHQLQHSSSEKQNSILQLQQQCQASEAQAQVSIYLASNCTH